MIWARRIGYIVVLCVVAACDPTASGTGPGGSSQADYERHKANREAYLYQGL